jgi:MoaA/NifB/PqqE/SkfB family radical SAM enzyme
MAELGDLLGIDLEVSRVCNLACVRCNRQYQSSLAHGKGPVYLSTRNLNNLLDCLPKVGLVGFMGDGEPLVGPFEDLLEVLNSRGVRSILTTNGTLVTRERVSSWKMLGLDRVHLSVDSLDEDVLGILRPGLSVGHIANAAAILRSGGLRLLVNFVMYGGNLGELPNMAEFCKFYGAELVLLLPLCLDYDLEGPTRRPFTCQEDISVFEAGLEIVDRLGIVHNNVSIRPQQKDCVFSKWPYVSMEGNLHLCAYAAGQGQRTEYYFGHSATVTLEDFKLGNIFEESFESIWKKKPPQTWKTPSGYTLDVEALSEARRIQVSCTSCLFRWGQACY